MPLPISCVTPIATPTTSAAFFSVSLQKRIPRRFKNKSLGIFAFLNICLNNDLIFTLVILLFVFLLNRVLLERLIVNRPHPWGLLITFIELIKNPVFKFWNHEFVHCAPEIEKLFESVARSCMVVQKQTPRDAENHD